MNRRQFLASSCISTAALALSACAGMTPDQLKADVLAIDQGLTAELAALKQIPTLKMPEATWTQIDTILANIQSDASAVATSLTPNADTVQAIANSVTALVPLVTPYYPVAPFVAAAVQAALALVPVILASVGKAPAATSAVATMTPDQARAVLRTAAVAPTIAVVPSRT